MIIFFKKKNSCAIHWACQFVDERDSGQRIERYVEESIERSGKKFAVFLLFVLIILTLSFLCVEWW